MWVILLQSISALMSQDLRSNFSIYEMESFPSFSPARVQPAAINHTPCRRRG